MYWPARAALTAGIAGAALLLAALAPPSGVAADPAPAVAKPPPWRMAGGSFPVAESSGAATTPGLSDGRPDITATPLGFVVGAGPIAWGHTVRVDDPNLLKATASGPAGDLCVLAPAGFRTFNKGTAATGAFKTTVYRDQEVVHSAEGSLPPNSGDQFELFDLPLRHGLNVIRVVVDSDDQVEESDEDNIFTIGIDVALDCAAAAAPGR